MNEEDVLLKETLSQVLINAVERIQRLPIKEDQISINKNCTFAEADLFNSYRRDGIKSSQWSCIMSRF